MSELNDEKRRTIRTVFQSAVSLLAAAPLLVDASGIPETTAGVGVLLAVAAGVTRVMALPQVNDFIERVAPWLAKEPKSL